MRFGKNNGVRTGRFGAAPGGVDVAATRDAVLLGEVHTVGGAAVCGDLGKLADQSPTVSRRVRPVHKHHEPP